MEPILSCLVNLKDDSEAEVGVSAGAGAGEASAMAMTVKGRTASRLLALPPASVTNRVQLSCRVLERAEKDMVLSPAEAEVVGPEQSPW